MENPSKLKEEYFKDDYQLSENNALYMDNHEQNLLHQKTELYHNDKTQLTQNYSSSEQSSIPFEKTESNLIDYG